MPVFDIYLNGKKVGTAGVGDRGVLTAMVSWVRREGERRRAGRRRLVEVEELKLDVGGLLSSTEEHLTWLDRKLEVGDEVRIRIVADAKVDRPKSRQRRNPAKDLRSEKQYVKEMAKRFGWTVQTRP